MIEAERTEAPASIGERLYRWLDARFGVAKVVVFEAGGELRALDAKCTHEGCTVQFVPGDSLIWCACHNGKFDLDGRVLSGPPPRPLVKWIATREGNDVVLTMEKA